MSAKSSAIAEYEAARARGARHEAAAVLARHAIETGDVDLEAFGSGAKLLVAARRKGTEHEPPVAFLASFAGREEQVIFLLKRGVTRVGRGAPFGDFVLPERLQPPIEARQWLVVQRPGQVLVMADHHTNDSFVLPHEVPAIAGACDPRWSDRYDYGKLRADAGQLVALDWEGTVVHELREGDVLLTCYSALVFGMLGPGMRIEARVPS